MCLEEFFNLNVLINFYIFFQNMGYGKFTFSFKKTLKWCLDKTMNSLLTSLGVRFCLNKEWINAIEIFDNPALIAKVSTAHVEYL